MTNALNEASPDQEVPYETDVNNGEAVAQQNNAEEKPPNKDVASPNVSESAKDKEYNWKRARQQLEELQWENKQLRERLDAPPKAPSEDEFSEIERLAEDEILTKAQTLKLNKRETKKYIQETLANFKKEMLMETLDERIRSRYPDYFSVATEENVEELKRDPLFVKALRGLDNPYDQACYIYRELSQRGVTATDTREKRQLEENASKPRSAHSLGTTSPLHVANDYSSWPSKDLKSRLYQEMVEASKGA